MSGGRQKRLLWFVGIYAVSVLSFAAVTYLLRWILKEI